MESQPKGPLCRWVADEPPTSHELYRHVKVEADREATGTAQGCLEDGCLMTAKQIVVAIDRTNKLPTGFRRTTPVWCPFH